MDTLSDYEFEQIQSRELGYWANTPYDPRGPWYYYDRKFIGSLPYEGVVADVGSGPVPYLMNHNIRYTAGVAIDPLLPRYIELARYRPMWDMYGKGIQIFTDLSELNFSVDAMFMLNMLDHVDNPERVIIQGARRIRKGGKLFIYVDIDKEPDAMHPHIIDNEWLLERLDPWFDNLYWEIERSWKFSNNIAWYVGERKR